MTHRRVCPYARSAQTPASCNRWSHCCKRFAWPARATRWPGDRELGQIYENGHNPFSTLRRQVVTKRRDGNPGLSFPLPMARLHWSKKERLGIGRVNNQFPSRHHPLPFFTNPRFTNHIHHGVHSHETTVLCFEALRLSGRSGPRVDSRHSPDAGCCTRGSPVRCGAAL